jgi:hypothetical protein
MGTAGPDNSPAPRSFSALSDDSAAEGGDALVAYSAATVLVNGVAPGFLHLNRQDELSGRKVACVSSRSLT